ncbi:MAG: hypothetical protein BWY09_02939 [Candidatus Hydrogenedentes bacterium ADurb.Bin179]|nr:MAG: hypothetical protein BWY09_02939 [Candidatus Hydrogenedentes bacterium ADurb.Bin179]
MTFLARPSRNLPACSREAWSVTSTPAAKPASLSLGVTRVTPLKKPARARESATVTRLYFAAHSRIASSTRSEMVAETWSPIIMAST